MSCNCGSYRRAERLEIELKAARAELAQAKQANLDISAMVTKLAGERDENGYRVLALQARLDAVISHGAITDNPDNGAYVDCTRDELIYALRDIRAAATGATK